MLGVCCSSSAKIAKVHAAEDVFGRFFGWVAVFFLQTFSLFLNTQRSFLSNKHCSMFVVVLKVEGESGAEQEYSVSKAKVRLDRAWSPDGWVTVMCSAFTRSEKFL